MATYLLNGITFTSKDAIKKHVQGIFAAYKEGQSLNADDQKFVLALLEWHPHASQKIGVGVASVRIHIPKPWTTKGFLLVRVDGSTTDFSYKVCLNPKLADQTVKFAAACRRAIAWEVAEFKRSTFGEEQTVWCSEEMREITKSESHVDHYPVPFCDLVDQYVAQTGIERKNVGFIEGDNVAVVKFSDPLLEQDFANWHRQNAQLRIISGKANVSLGAHRRTAS